MTVMSRALPTLILAETGSTALPPAPACGMSSGARIGLSVEQRDGRFLLLHFSSELPNLVVCGRQSSAHAYPIDSASMSAAPCHDEFPESWDLDMIETAPLDSNKAKRTFSGV